MGRWLIVLVLLGSCADGGDDGRDPSGVHRVLPQVPSTELPFRMDRAWHGTGYPTLSLTETPTRRYLLGVTATPFHTFVVFPPEGREGLDIAWAGYDAPWVRASLLTTPREDLQDVHMAAAPEGRVAIVTRTGPRPLPRIRLQLFDPDEGVILDRLVPQAPPFGSNRRTSPETTTDLAVFPWTDGDIDVIYKRRWAVEDTEYTDIRRNRWDAARGAFRGEEVLHSVSQDGLHPREAAARTGFTVDIAGEMTLEPLTGANQGYAAEGGYAILSRRRLTSNGRYVANDFGYDVIIAPRDGEAVVRETVPAVADPQWGLNRNTPNPGIVSPIYDVSVDGLEGAYAGPWVEGFAGDGTGYQRYGPRLVPLPSRSNLRTSFLMEEGFAAEYPGGWYWENDCGEIIQVMRATPRYPRRDWGLPNIWVREQADDFDDDVDASYYCPWNTRRVALVDRGWVGGPPDALHPEVASGPRAAHVAVCASERPVICSGAVPPPEAALGEIPRFDSVDPAPGSEVDASSLRSVTVRMADGQQVGTLCVHELERPGGQCERGFSGSEATLQLPEGWLQPRRTYRVSASAGQEPGTLFQTPLAVLAPPGTTGPVTTFRTR